MINKLIYAMVFLLSFIYFTLININVLDVYNLSKSKLNDTYGIQLTEKIENDTFVYMKATLGSIDLFKCKNMKIDNSLMNIKINIDKLEEDKLNLEAQKIDLKLNYLIPFIVEGKLNIKNNKTFVKINLLNSEISLYINKKDYKNNLSNFNLKGDRYEKQIKY